MAKLGSEIEAKCPCCNATLIFDLNLKRIVSHLEPERSDKPKLSEAENILADEKRRREALFKRSIDAEKTRGDALSKRFDEALERARKEPIERPKFDFDLD